MTVANHKQAKPSRKQAKHKGVLFFVRISEETRDGLRRIGEQEERSMSSIARFAFREYIERHGVEVQAELAGVR